MIQAILFVKEDDLERLKDSSKFSSSYISIDVEDLTARGFS
jgi:hypothetical protein